MGGRPFPFGEQAGEGVGAPLESERLSPDDVPRFPDRPLYDPRVLRTIFFRFPGADWEEELSDFRKTDVEVPADMIVDGKTYPSVGIRFRGNTSLMMVPAGKKRSLNVSVDHAIDGQRLYGHRSLNLLNSSMDPSFLRTVLYHRIGGEFLPVPRANLVKVVINGESWGIYVNVEQFNKDFLRERFGTEDGSRWKVPQDLSGGASLRYRGEEVEAYTRSYELKTKDGADEAWQALIQLTKALEETPSEEVEAALSPILDIDEALWFLAVDNVFLDDDGYGTRGSDFLVYLDPERRFHMIPYDNNETFRSGGMMGGPPGPGGGPRGGRGGGFPGDFPGFPGGPPGGLPGGPPDGDPGGGASPGGSAIDGASGGVDPGDGGSAPRGGPLVPVDEDGPRRGRGGFPGFPGFPAGEGGARLSPLARADDPSRPLSRALLSVPHLRARYLAHVRTLAERWLDWNVLGPVVEEYRALLGDEIARDTKKLDTTEGYERSVDGAADGGGGEGGSDGADRRRSGSLRSFADERRAFLLAHAEVARARPQVLAVRRVGDPLAGAPVAIAAETGGETAADTVLLRHAEGPVGLFLATEMRDDGAAPDEKAGDGIFAAEIPPQPAGTLVRYYVEAQGPADSTGAFGTTFLPEGAESHPRTYLVRAPSSPGFPVRINEVLAAGSSSTKSAMNGAAVGNGEAKPGAQASEKPGDKTTDAANGKEAQGAEARDWVELHNGSDQPVDLSGLFLSDDPDLPRKWRFPDGTSIGPRGFLIVWADAGTKGNGSKGNGGNVYGAKAREAKASPSLHASFRISREGESLWLVDRDERGNSILDRVVFGASNEGTSQGRLPDGKGELRPTVPTPGAENRR